jgi:hypothetical protein
MFNAMLGGSGTGPLRYYYEVKVYILLFMYEGGE